MPSTRPTIPVGSTTPRPGGGAEGCRVDHTSLALDHREAVAVIPPRRSRKEYPYTGSTDCRKQWRCFLDRCRGYAEGVAGDAT